MSPVGQLFYTSFVNKEADKDKDFYNKKIIIKASMDNARGDTANAKRLYQVYARLNFKNRPVREDRSILAEIKNVGINREISKTFDLQKPTKFHITGTGENCSGDLKTWCDFGWIEDANGKTIWQMPAQPAVPAGGAIKNQRVETVITLPAGTYILHYKSDSGHAYDNWDSLPPDNFFWGITLASLH